MKKILFIVAYAISVLFFSCEHNPGGRSNNPRKPIYSRPTQHQVHRTTSVSTTTSGKIRVHMRENNGIYMIPVKIDGTEMDVIFDTGASDILLSTIEAAFLVKQGKLTEDDIIEACYNQVADGSIVEGTIVNLKTVQIANKVLHNVRATVVNNIEAPLLLGQSALSRFGKINIDYERKVIEFID